MLVVLHTETEVQLLTPLNYSNRIPRYTRRHEMYDVRVGGLYRCCVEHGLSTKPNPSITRCPNCGTALRFVRGAWEWDKEAT